MRQPHCLSHIPIPATPGEMPLPPGVEVHMVDVRGSTAQLTAAASLLAADELERAGRIVVPAARRRFAISRATLRLLLAKPLEVEPTQVKLAYDANGKPRLEHEEQLTFNLSHSGDLALIALRQGGRVGVDIERIDPSRDWRRISRSACSEDERFHLLGELRIRGAAAFFERWTAKEALLKAVGVGLAGGPANLVLVRGSDGEGRLQLREPPCDCSIHRLRVPTGYKAALALLDTQDRLAA
jgi:4'-phosphopantetheinyl transferase